MEDLTKNLITVIKKSKTLSKEQKQEMLKMIKTLNLKDTEELMAIFNFEQIALNEIESKYKKALNKLNKEYQKTVQIIKMKEIPLAIKQKSDNEHKKEENDAEEILKKLK